MRRLLDRMRQRAAREDGFTLPELLMATLVGLMVVGAGTLMFTAAMHSQPGLTKRDNAIQQARFTMERLTRELRQGATVFTATSSQLSFVTYVHSATCGGSSSTRAIACRVSYACTTGNTASCTRTEAKPDGTSPGPSVIVASGLSTPDIFTFSPSSTAPTFIGATFTFPGQNGSDAITVSDGATLRK